MFWLNFDPCISFSIHRYEAVYAKKLPEHITGESFLEKYADHNDTVTVIDPKRTYAVKAPTKHPIYENFRVEVLLLLIEVLIAACVCGHALFD